jgi:dTDP-4-dehydrorhamnose reductase
LGSEIKDIAESYKNIRFFFMDLPALDICNSSQLNIFIKENNIDTVINCAAYTAVDASEQNAVIAEQVNGAGILNLVQALTKVNRKLIHISTDYVFDGNGFLPYQESDKTNPKGVYGKTKRNGELAVISGDIDGIVIRTSWLYSAYGTNFVKTMRRLGKERNELDVIFDQVGTPTNASDLAKTCLDILAYSKETNINAK